LKITPNYGKTHPFLFGLIILDAKCGNRERKADLTVAFVPGIDFSHQFVAPIISRLELFKS